MKWCLTIRSYWLSITDNNCDCCNQPDSNKHRILECSRTKEIRDWTEKMLRNKMKVNFSTIYEFWAGILTRMKLSKKLHCGWQFNTWVVMSCHIISVRNRFAFQFIYFFNFSRWGEGICSLGTPSKSGPGPLYHLLICAACSSLIPYTLRLVTIKLNSHARAFLLFNLAI